MIKLNDFAIVVVKKLNLHKKVEKKKMYYGLILSTKYKTPRLDGSFINFDKNKKVLFCDFWNDFYQKKSLKMSLFI